MTQKFATWDTSDDTKREGEVRERERERGGRREREREGGERERQKEREFHKLLKQVRFMDTLGKCFYRKERLKPLSLLLFFVFFLFSFADIGRALQALH